MTAALARVFPRCIGRQDVTAVPAPEVTTFGDSDIPHSFGQDLPSPSSDTGRTIVIPSLCFCAHAALVVVRTTLLTPKFPLGQKGSRPKRHKSDYVSTSSSSALEVLTAASSATKIAVFVNLNLLHGLSLPPLPWGAVGVSDALGRATIDNLPEVVDGGGPPRCRYAWAERLPGVVGRGYAYLSGRASRTCGRRTSKDAETSSNVGV